MLTNYRIIWITVIGAVLVNGVALLVGRGSFVHWFVADVLAIYFGGSALVVAGCAYLLRNRLARARRFARGATAVALVSASAPISLIPGRALAKRDIAAAESRCESLIPHIDEYHRIHGVYPANISLMSGTAETVRIGRQCAYGSDGSGFFFNLGDPRKIMSFIGYDSRTRRWSEWH